MNLRYYYPDFVAVDENGTHWLLETKGRKPETSPTRTRRLPRMVRKRHGAHRQQVELFESPAEGIRDLAANPL